MGPWGLLNPLPDPNPTVSAVVHLGSLKDKTSDERYCMLDSGADVGHSVETRHERRKYHVCIGG